ncbi:hypothetical protein ACNKHU_22140 [Shigella flexneri]
MILLGTTICYSFMQGMSAGKMIVVGCCLYAVQ